MAKQTVNVGTTPNARDGDPLRNAFTKINQNFDELYAGNFADPEAVGSALKPDTDATYDLGASDKQWADLYVRDFIYLNGVRLEGANGNLLVEGATIAADSQGSVFGDDSTLLVDGVNNVINLNGTISTHIIPTTTETYDLGSASNRFRDLYLSGSTIDLGGTTISTVGGELRFGGVKVPTVTDLAGGSITVNPTGDLQGSVFADDSTLLVDGVAGKIRGDIESATVNITSTVGDVNITAADDIDLETTGANADIRLTSSDNIRLSSVSDTSIESNTYVGIFTDAGNSLHNFIFSETGYFEVLADNGGINIDNELNFMSGGSPSSTLSLNSGVLEVVTNSGFRLKNNVGDTQLEYLNTETGVLNVAGTINGKLKGDVEGSVFADDSTLLVDGVNGVIPTSVLQGNIPINSIDKFVNRSTFTSDFTIPAGSATLLQFDAFQGSQAFDAVTYQWAPANTGLYRLDFVLGLTASEVDQPLIVFLYNVTDNANQIQLFNGTFTGSILSMSGTTYLTAGKNYQFGIIGNVAGDALILDKDLTSAGIEELTRVS